MLPSSSRRCIDQPSSSQPQQQQQQRSEEGGGTAAKRHLHTDAVSTCRRLGETQSLVLALPSPNYVHPSVDSSALWSTPRTSLELLMDLLTKPVATSSSSSSSSLELTPIGRSMLSLSRWRWCRKNSRWCLGIWNPVAGEEQRLVVLDCVPTLPTTTMNSSVEGALLRFRDAPRVAFAAMHSSDADLSLKSTSSSIVGNVLEQFRKAIHPEPVESWVDKLLQCVLLSAATAEDHVTSILVHGERGVGKTFQILRLLRVLASCVVGVSGDGSVKHSLRPWERSPVWVDAARAFEQSHHVTNPAQTLILPLRLGAEQEAAADDDDEKILFHQFIVYDNIQCVGGGSDEVHVTLAAHALAERLESLRRDVDSRLPRSCGRRDRRRPVVVIAITQQVQDVHPVLLSQRALQQHSIDAHVPSEHLRRFIVHSRTKRNGGGGGEDVREALVNYSAGWTIPKILCDMARCSTMMALRTGGGGAETTTPAEVDPSVAVTSHSPSSSLLVGVDNIMSSIETLLLRPLQQRAQLKRLGLSPPKGALIVGPSGSGKTALLADLYTKLLRSSTTSSLSSSLRLHVVLVDALSLLTKEVGQSEKNIAALLSEARASSPSVLFLDNLDAIAPPRGQNSRETNVTADRTLSTLLVELDGVREHHDASVLVVASAPSIESLDPAVIRPGRLDIHLQLQLPTVQQLTSLIVNGIGPEIVSRLHNKSDGARAEDGARQVAERVEAVVAHVATHLKRPLTYADGRAAVRSVALEFCGEYPTEEAFVTSFMTMTTEGGGGGESCTATSTTEWNRVEDRIRSALSQR